MPRGDKSRDTGKQKQKAAHIEKGSERRGVTKDEAKRRARATVNKQEGGGKKGGSAKGRDAGTGSKGKVSRTTGSSRKATARGRGG